MNSAHDITIAEIRRKLPNANETHLEYFFTYSTGGIIKVIRKWINDDMNIPTEEVVQILESMNVMSSQ